MSGRQARSLRLVRSQGGAARALVVMARAPEGGRVKTRLAATLGDDMALDIYRALGREVMRGVAPLSACDVVIACTPDTSAEFVADWLGVQWRLEGQGAGDLGQRMASAIERRCAEGASRIVVTGTDCPDVDASIVDEAFTALDNHDVVIGPAADGGYYLIGVRQPRPALFREVPWSCAETRRVTLERAMDEGLTVALLAERRDIDTAEDWTVWRHSKSGCGHPGPPLRS